MLKPDTAEGVDLMAPIEPGTYQAQITAVEATKSKKGAPMLVLKTDISVNGKTKKRTAYVVVSGPGAAGFDTLLRATHNDKLADTYKDSSISADQKPDFDEQTLVGQDVMVVIDSQLDQQTGQARDNIKSWVKA